MQIRRFQLGDEVEVSTLILTTLYTTNRPDYTDEQLEKEAISILPHNILKRVETSHFYVVCEDGRMVGTGAIGPYMGKEDESILLNLFVLPDCQGRGIGRLIVQTLEQDEYFRRAKRVEISASVTGAPFYLKLGYQYKNGNQIPDEERVVRMEKFNQV